MRPELDTTLVKFIIAENTVFSICPLLLHTSTVRWNKKNSLSNSNVSYFWSVKTFIYACFVLDYGQTAACAVFPATNTTLSGYTKKHTHKNNNKNSKTKQKQVYKMQKQTISCIIRVGRIYIIKCCSVQIIRKSLLHSRTESYCWRTFLGEQERNRERSKTTPTKKYALFWPKASL